MKNYLLFLGAILSIPPFFLQAQSLSKVQNEAKRDLQASIDELTKVRNLIEEEKLPLARKVTVKEDKAKELRTKLEHYLRLRDNRETSLLQLEKEVLENEAELEFSLNLLKDYITSWHQFNPSAEQTLWKDKLSNILKNQKSADEIESSFETYFNAMSLSIQAVKNSSGGFTFSSDAIVPPEGTREKGTFWSIGPTILFKGESGIAGILEKNSATDYNQEFNLSPDALLQISSARLTSVPYSLSQEISRALDKKDQVGELATVPLDPTLGKALIMEKGKMNTLEELKKGGIWIYPIMFFAVLSICIASFKAFQIVQVKLPQGAASFEEQYQGPFELLRKTASGYKGKNPEILEEILYETIIDIQVKLEKALPLIAVTAATAPLLGLLGTVTGMIDVFRQITNFSNPENSELARGISEALVTTKFGLVTAIPSLIVHALLTRRLQGIISKLEGFSSRLVRLKQETPDSTD